LAEPRNPQALIDTLTDDLLTALKTRAVTAGDYHVDIGIAALARTLAMLMSGGDTARVGRSYGLFAGVFVQDFASVMGVDIEDVLTALEQDPDDDPLPLSKPTHLH
jgi:hypothetical protein